MDLNNFAAAHAAVKEAQFSDEPTSKRDATRLATRLSTAIDPLVEWAAEFAEALTRLVDTADELRGADADERPDHHGDFIEAAETVADALIDIGLTEPTVKQLAASVAS